MEPAKASTLQELVTRRDVLSFLAKEPDGATSAQIAHALRSVGAQVTSAAVGVLLAHMRRDGLVTGKGVAYGGKRGVVTTWRLAQRLAGSSRSKSVGSRVALRMVAHATRPAHALRRNNCAHETECVAEVADLDPSAEACECPPSCPHLEVPT